MTVGLYLALVKGKEAVGWLPSFGTLYYSTELFDTQSSYHAFVKDFYHTERHDSTKSYTHSKIWPSDSPQM